MKRILFVIYTCMAVLISCGNDDDTNKISVAVFGGSLSSAKESEEGKDIWRKELGVFVVTHGLSSAGFTDMATQKISVPRQIEYAPPYDVYILWASTNDTGRGSIGDLESTDPSTQSGGIRESVSLIKSKNPNAQILFFCSLPVFTERHDKLMLFVEGQKEICDYLGIPYLDQSVFFNEENYKGAYKDDKIHLTKSGYKEIAPLQVEFMKEKINWEMPQ